jgi:flagellar protein FliS
MNTTTASKAYARVGVESGVLAADPHKLISMLYQGALLAIASAKNAMMRKDIAAKGAAISKAITIINEGLLASLDKDVGGDLAHNLASLYDYMGRRLLTANMNDDKSALDEVAHLLNDLKGAWENIRTSGTVLDLNSGAAAPTPAKLTSIASQPAKPASTASNTPQQRVVNKVQLAYGRV